MKIKNKNWGGKRKGAGAKKGNKNAKRKYF